MAVFVCVIIELMKQSFLFTKTRREAPKDEQAKNAELLIRAGFIHKEMAGVYTWLPLGLRVLKKIEQIIREEMNAIGGQEIEMTTLQDSAVWKKSGRWDDEAVDIWFKTALKNGNELGIANTHEEPLTQMLTHFANSHKDFPLYIYQFQTKFRNELRAKSGVMRAREFLMKDMYSFSKTPEEFKEFYERCADSYLKIFRRIGLGDVTYRTAAAGGSFTTGLTDEFQTVSDAGEDTIYIDREKGFAINKEVYTDENVEAFGMRRSSLEEAKSIEVGNIFPLGTKYPEALGLYFTDENGKKQTPVMGSYGIGLGRVIGAIAETFADEGGLVWPEEVAPFKVHILTLPSENADVKKQAEDLYGKLNEQGIEALYDDRDTSAGEKFADGDLIGIPLRVVVSEKSLIEGGVEIKKRTESESRIVNPEEALGV